jgi:hypothetical protein
MQHQAPKTSRMAACEEQWYVNAQPKMWLPLDMYAREGIKGCRACTCGGLGHARRVGQAECEDAAALLDQERVRVAVVAAGKLDELHNSRWTQ